MTTAQLSPAARTVAPSAMAPARQAAPPTRRLPLRRRDISREATIAAAGLLGSALIAASAPAWERAAPTWRLRLPDFLYPDLSLVVFAGFALGAALLCGAWIGLMRVSRARASTQRRRVRTVLAMLALWSLPILLGPPLLSYDVYSYAAQGELASQGIDPTSTGPSALGGGEFLRAVDPVWRRAPAPYGPTAIATSQAVVTATGHDAAGAVWGFRAVAILGVALAGIGVAAIARSYGVDPAFALALGVANPLVLLHFVGGVHNDALMLGLLACGIAAARRDRRVLAFVLVALAASVKVPAACAFVFLGWEWAGPSRSTARRLLGAAGVAAAGVALVAGLCVAVGIGYGWITALSNTGKVTSTVAPVTLVGLVLEDFAGGLGLGLGSGTILVAARGLGLLAAGVVCLWLLIRSDRTGTTTALGLALLIVIALGPVVWPWYLPVGLALVAAGGVGRFRSAAVALVIAAVFVAWPTSAESVAKDLAWVAGHFGLPIVGELAGGLVAAATSHQEIVLLLVAVLVGACAFVAQRLEAARGRRGVADLARPEPLVAEAGSLLRPATVPA